MQIERFLERHPDFVVRPVPALLGGALPGRARAGPRRRCLALSPGRGTAPTGSSPPCWSASRHDRDPPRPSRRRAAASPPCMSRPGAAPMPASWTNATWPTCPRRGWPPFYQPRDPRPARAAMRCSSPPPAGPTSRPTGRGRSPPIVGFASGGRARRRGLAEGEVETLYLLDDYRDRGVGRRLMRAMAAHLRGHRLPLGHGLGAGGQPRALFLPAARRPPGDAGDDPRRRPAGAADGLRLGPDRDAAGRDGAGKEGWRPRKALGRAGMHCPATASFPLAAGRACGP